MANKTVSIIIPIYNEEETLDKLFKRLEGALETVNEDIEYVCINDGSTDASIEILKHKAKKDRRIKVIDFAKNFGHQIAVTAGLDHCMGDCAVIIDADLQDPPELIPRLIEKWKENYQVVYARRTKRKGEGFLKLYTARLFYRFLKRMTKVNIPLDTGDYRLIDRTVIKTLKNMPERYRFIRGMVSWVGFNQIGVDYERDERYAGITKYPFSKSLSLAFDAIISFSFAPLRVAMFLGFIVSLMSFIYAIYVIYKEIFTDYEARGWPSLMVAILFLGGIQLITLGIIGEYVGRTSIEIKKRPIYIVKEKINYE